MSRALVLTCACVLWLGAAALALPGALGAQQLTPARYYQLKLQADSLIRAANPAAAQPILEQLLKYDDRDPELWLAAARGLQSAGQHAQAIEAYRQVVKRGFGYGADHYYAIARNFALLGNRDSAVAYTQRTLDAKFSGRERFRTDQAFEPLRADPAFRRLAGFVPEGLSRDDRWRFDLGYLTEEAKRLHASFDRRAHMPAFDSAAAALRREIPRLDDVEIITRMRALIVLLDDGHSGVYLENAPRLPVTLYWFKDGVFVIRDVSGAGEPAAPGDTTLLGSQVVAVEGVGVEQALARVAPYVSRDNEMGVRSIAPLYLGSRGILRSAGILKDTTVLTLTLRTRNGRPKTVRLPFVKPDSIASRLGTLPGDSASRPMWLAHARKAYWARPLPEASAVYFQFNAVRHDPGQPIPQFAKHLTQMLDSTGAQNLIVDLRHNGGGNSYLFPPFIKQMIVFKEKNPAHRVFVIIGRETFSAAQNFTTAIDQWVGATFVGEPSGSRANFTGESSLFRLPATNTRANISWRWHQYAQWVDQRMYIAPQIPAEATSNDYFSGRDPAMEAIMEVIRGR